MTTTKDDIRDILKELYDDEMEDYIMDEEPLVAMVPKSTDGGGYKKIIPFSWSTGGGIALKFEAAQASKDPSRFERWEVDWRDMFVTFSLDHKAVKLTHSSSKAFIELVEREAKAKMKLYRKGLGAYIFGDGGGALGQIESGQGTATLTLKDRHSLSFLEVGMELQGSVDDGSGGAGLIANIHKIGKINRAAKTITVSSGVWDATAFANNNYIFLRDSYNIAIHGLKAWIPDAAPGATLFNGVDRTQDDRMFGVIKTGDPSEDSNLAKFVMSLITDVAMEGGSPNLGVCQWPVLNMIAKQMDAKIVYSRGVRADGSETAKAGFGGIEVVSPAGTCKLMGSRNCPAKRLYVLTKEDLLLETVEDPLGSFLEYADDDTRFARHGTQNAMEARLGNYLNLCMSEPKAHGVGLIDAYLA